MKKRFTLSKSMVMLVTVSNMALLNSQATISVEAESLDTNPVSILSAENFSFTATIIDSKGATLAGKSVVLTDITDGTPKEIKTLSSNEQGKALFTNLPLNRNISVSVDGKEKGYTFRTSQANSALAASFTADGIGTGTPGYSTKPLVVAVSNQDAEPVANKEVVLKDRAGNIIDKVLSDEAGMARFTKNLLDGTFYVFYIDDKKMGETIPGINVRVAIDLSASTPAPATPITPSKATIPGHFSFTVTILGEDGKVIEGKNVSLSDITDGKEEVLKTGQSDSNGQVVFAELPLARNISVSIDGKAQGYTIRTDKDGQTKAAAFYVSGTGSKLPIYTKIPATIYVVNEEVEGISGQTVTLFNTLGQKVAEMNSDEKGKVVFSDNLMEGTFYTIFVNGIKMDSITPGNSLSVALSSEQIKTAPKQSEETETPSNKEELPTSVSTETTSSEATSSEASKKGEHESVDSQKETKPSTQAANHPGQENKKVLPKTGEHRGLLASLIGFLLLAISSLIFFSKKSENN